MTIWNLEVDRVRVRVLGAWAHGLNAADLRAFVEVAVRNVLETAPLPNGRTAHASVRVKVPSLASEATIASAVANGVSHAVGGRAHG
ncbi:MAG TPA: hypothetical protein VGJ64_04450 [Gemmatimonadaceae bacterium]|jgi:hypothetical protein